MPEDSSHGPSARVDPPRLLGAETWDELSEREQRVAEAAALVNTLLQAAPVGFGFVDSDLRFQRVNVELARITGLGIEELRGRAVATVAPAPSVVEPAMRRVLETGAPVVDLAVSDSGHHLLVSMFPVDNAKGERAGMGVLMHDVTERTRLVHRLQALADAAVGISSLAVDEVLALVSERVSEVLDADDVEVSTAVDGPLELSDNRLYAPLVARDGRRFGVIRVSARRDGHAFDEADEATLVQLARFASIAIENARLHRETEQAERRYRSLVESSSALVFVTDAEGRWQTALPSWEAYTGQMWPEYEGKGWLDRCHPDDADRIVETWTSAITSGEFFTTALQLWHAPSGAYRHIRLQAAPVVDSTGRLVEWMGTATDIEDRVQAQRLEEAQRIARFGSFSVDLATSWVSVSREVNRIAGLPLDNTGFTVQEALELLPPDERPSTATALGALAAGEKIEIGDAHIVRPDGTERIVVASFEPRLDAHGAAVELHGTVRDVTEERALAALERERRVVLALQDALLPENLPAVPELEIAVRYLAASEAAIGGDWYDAFLLGDGSVALAIGDVTGHGVASAAAMSQVRNSLRAYMLEGHSPASVMALLDRLIGLMVPEAFVTAIVATYEPNSGTLRLARAGHPFPLLRDEAIVSELDMPGGPPLGTGYGDRQTEQTMVLPVGADLVLYTDGLVERRGAAIDAGVDRATGALRSSGLASAEAVCSALVDACIDTGTLDDVCILAIRRVGS